VHDSYTNGDFAESFSPQAMLYLIHKLIVVTYVIAPIVALGIDFRRSRRKEGGGPTSGLFMTISIAVLIGAGLCVVYTRAVGGRLLFTQVLLATYFTIGLLLILKAFDHAMRAGSARLLRHGQDSKHPALWGIAHASSFLVRVFLLIALGLPYVMAAVMTYRPKVGLWDDPKTQLGFPFERVSFKTSDGVNIRAWWIPALESSPGRRGEDFGEKTVIVCHGLGANKSNQLIMARPFVPNGYNVLIFDFRAHGESGGQLSSIGDLERNDVLGAVKWLRENRPERSKQIFGVGASMGAAALIAAAVDPSPEGQAIDAVAVFDTFDNLPSEVRSITRGRFPQPVRWLVQNVGLPMASFQVGANLSRFAPDELVQRLWPRPILIIHATRDEIIEFDRGQQLFNSAVQPKERLWIDGADHNSIINDDTAARRVLQFFESAQRLPVI